MSRLADRKDMRESLMAFAGARGSVVAALDLGASKVGCFIMRGDGARREDRSIHIAGVAHVQARGVRGGAIVNPEEAAQAIAQAVERAETMAGLAISGVIVTTAGGQMASHRVGVQVSLGSKPITDHDLSRALQMALVQARFPGRRPIHLLPIAWSVDGQRGLRDPRGAFGQALGLDLLVVTMNESAWQTLHHCTEMAHVQLEGVVASPFASGLAVLEEDEMDLGAICIDMGGGSTSTAVFTGGSLIHVDSLSVGGAHVTADIARGLSTTLAGAERLKTLHGSAIASTKEDREMIEAPARGDDPSAAPIVAPRSLLMGVIAPRVEETLELVRERLKASGAPLHPGAGVILTGGASSLTGIAQLATRVFDRPVRLGRPRRAPHLAEAASGPAFAAAAGVLHRAAFGPREAARIRGDAAPSSPTPVTSQPARNEGPVGKVAGWLREHL